MPNFSAPLSPVPEKFCQHVPIAFRLARLTRDLAPPVDVAARLRVE